jgi:serine/threonine protein kinase
VCQSLPTAEEDIFTRDIGLDDVAILLWFESEESTRLAWSESPTCKVSYSKLLQRREQMQPQSDPFLRQVRLLREAFRNNSAPSISRIEQIASETGLEDFEVSFWFETERSMQSECVTTYMSFQQDLWSPQFSHDSVYSRSSLTGTSPVSDNIKLNHPFHPEPGLAGNLHLDLAQWEAPSLAAQSNKRRRPVHTSSNATSSSLSSPPDKRLRRNIVQGSYPCLFESCNSIAADVTRWKDHQLRLHFPKRVWICWLKKDDNSDCKHGPVTRADNFVTHLVNEHRQSRGPELQRLVQSKGLNVRDLYHEECGFCNERLKSWEESMNHISRHLSRGSAAESWEHRCSTDHDLLNHIEYQTSNQDASSQSKKPDDEDERHDDANEKGKGKADPTFGHQNQNSRDAGHCGNGSQESGDHAELGTDSSSTQKHAAYNDMLTECQEVSSNTATISVQADEVDADYVSLEILGHGGFSLVDKIVHRLSRKIYARKTTYYAKSPSRESVEVQFHNEIEILKTLQHPHLVKFIDAYALQDRLSILMSPVADESLTSFMSRFDQFPPVVQDKNKSSLWRWISCLASALAYLHDHLIRHQDIKPSNILVRSDQIFLTDFGNAKKFLDDGQAQVCDFRNKLTVTPMYCPPEAMRSGLQGFTADVFSLGCVYAEIITLCLDETLADFELFRSPNMHDGAFGNQLEKTVEWIESLQEDYRQAVLQHKAPPAVSLEMLCRMLDQDPEQRPTARQIQLKLVPCTCYSMVVTAIDMTDHTTPLHPRSVEGLSENDEISNATPQIVQTRTDITIGSESDERSQGAEREHSSPSPRLPNGKMQTAPRPAHISDGSSDTDTEENVLLAGQHIHPSPGRGQGKNPRRVETMQPQPKRFQSFINEPRTRRSSLARLRERFRSPHSRGDIATPEVPLARAFNAGYNSGLARYPRGRQRRQPTPPLSHERRPLLFKSPPMSPMPRSPSPPVERERRPQSPPWRPSPPLRRPRGPPSPPLRRPRGPPSPPLRRPSPPFTSTSCSVRTASSILSPSTEATSPRESLESLGSLGSCVSIDEGSLRRRADSRTEVLEDNFFRTRSRLKAPSANHDKEYLQTEREYDDLVVGSHSKQLSHHYQRNVI